MSRHSSDDQEQFNRLFVLGGKDCTETEFKEEFGKYGEVKDVWKVTDRRTGEDKGRAVARRNVKI